MTAQKIKKSDWEAFCSAVSHALEGSRAEIEVASLALGSQIETSWAPLIGITYDANDDIFDIALEETDHIVNEPKELIADVDDVAVNALEITDAEGTHHVVKLRDPLMLPAAH